MTNIQIFENPEFGEIRTIITGDTFSVVAKDVAERLGYTWDTNLIKHIPDEWKGANRIRTPGGTQEMWVLTEQGLYFFLARSDKPLPPVVGGAITVNDPYGVGEITYNFNNNRQQ
jgi:prophage antirepressor-like protein